MLSDILNSLQKFPQLIECGNDQTPIPISVVSGNSLHFQFFDSYIPLSTAKDQYCFKFYLGCDDDF